MTDQKLIRLIEDNGLNLHGDIEHFAHLVAAAERNRTWTQAHWTEYERSLVAAEREACALTCEGIAMDEQSDDSVALDCATAIRARGEK
jgi:hypothetical protein